MERNPFHDPTMGSTARRVQRPLELAFLGALVLGASVFAATHWTHMSTSRAAARGDTQNVPLRFRATELAAARSAGHICITDAHHGKICATFVAGERPAVVLTREIERRGLNAQISR